MCLVDSSTSIDIESDELGSQYECNDCNSRFRGLGKKVSCPTCQSTNVRKLN